MFGKLKSAYQAWRMYRQFRQGIKKARDEMKSDNLLKHKRTWLALAAIVAAVGTVVSGEAGIMDTIKMNMDSVILVAVALLSLFTASADVKKANGKS